MNRLSGRPSSSRHQRLGPRCRAELFGVSFHGLLSLPWAGAAASDRKVTLHPRDNSHVTFLNQPVPLKPDDIQGIPIAGESTLCPIHKTNGCKAGNFGGTFGTQKNPAIHRNNALHGCGSPRIVARGSYSAANHQLKQAFSFREYRVLGKIHEREKPRLRGRS